MESNPAVFTPPLSPDFPSLWDRYEKVVLIVWRIAFSVTLDIWQRELLRHVLEVYPKGHPRAGELRFRQVLISLGRQNGKTELASILGLIGLLRKANSLVIGIASSAEQARIVYRRTLQAIATTSLRKRFKKVTEGRGIHGTNGTVYELKAAKGAALQGLPVDTGVVDEVHLLKSELWTALVSGMGARPNTQIVGITTSGDETSELLIQLYETAEKAAGGDSELERFGAFIFQAPEARVPEDDETLLEWLKLANPALASGRLDPEIFLADVRSLPDPDIIRYRLNRFVASSNPFLPFDAWKACEAPGGYEFPMQGTLVFSMDITPEDSYATITAHRRTPDGHHHTELVAWLVNPTLEGLVRLCERLWAHNPAMYTGDGYKCRAVLLELKNRGYPVTIGTTSDAMNAASFLHRQVLTQNLTHAGNDLLNVQMPRAVRKNKGDVYRIDRTNSSVEIDAVMATALGELILDRQQDLPVQVFGIT